MDRPGVEPEDQPSKGITRTDATGRDAMPRSGRSRPYTQDVTTEPQPSNEIQDEDRVSLAPLDAETALRALLAIDPNGRAEDAEDDAE